MWRQLSGFDKFRFVCCVFGLPVTVVAVILAAMTGQWGMAAVQTGLVFSFVYYLYGFIWGRRGSREPQPRTINPGTPEFGTGPADS
jgi:hypothetical protein